MLEINWYFFAITMVVFLGLIAFLNAFFYKPVLEFMEARNASIKGDEESISKNLNDVEAKKLEIDSIIANANAEAKKIKQNALNEAKEKAANEVEAKRKLLEGEFSKYMQNLEASKDELKSSLAGKIPEFKNSLDKKIAQI